MKRQITFFCSNQQLAFNEILETKFSQQNNGNNNNNNNNNNNSVTTSLEARQTLPRSNPPIRGVLWNPTRTLPSKNTFALRVSYQVVAK